MNDDTSKVLDQAETARRGAIFSELHSHGPTFVIPNPWDVGSARMMAALGFEALATTSWGAATAAGRLDGAGAVARATALAHAKEIVEATDLPVSADLEDGFGPTPDDVAETIRAAAAIGLAGCSIEDTTGDPEKPIHDFDHAVARIQAAADAVRTLGRPFVLTARAENFSYGKPDLAETVARLQAFESCGADVLYAPELPDLETVGTVCGAVSAPVNVVAGLGLSPNITVAQYADAGVTRISVGSGFARLAFGAMLDAARAAIEAGDFSLIANAPNFAEFEALIRAATPGPH